MKFVQMPRKILPRIDGGCDYDVERWLILDAGKRGYVFWWPGSKAWHSIGHQEYRKGSLELLVRDKYSSITVLSGGRLSKNRLADLGVRFKIASFLGLRLEDIPELDPRYSFELV